MMEMTRVSEARPVGVEKSRVRSLVEDVPTGPAGDYAAARSQTEARRLAARLSMEAASNAEAALRVLLAAKLLREPLMIVPEVAAQPAEWETRFWERSAFPRQRTQWRASQIFLRARSAAEWILLSSSHAPVPRQVDSRPRPSRGPPRFA